MMHRAAKTYISSPLRTFHILPTPFNLQQDEAHHHISYLLVFCLVKKIKHTLYGYKSKNKCRFLELRNFARAHRNKRNSCALRTPFEGLYSLYMEAQLLTKVMTPDWECSMYFTTA